MHSSFQNIMNVWETTGLNQVSLLKDCFFTHCATLLPQVGVIICALSHMSCLSSVLVTHHHVLVHKARTPDCFAVTDTAISTMAEATGKNWIWLHARTHTHTRTWQLMTTVTCYWRKPQSHTASSEWWGDHYAAVPARNTIPPPLQASFNVTTLMETSCPLAAHCRCRSCHQWGK